MPNNENNENVEILIEGKSDGFNKSQRFSYNLISDYANSSDFRYSCSDIDKIPMIDSQQKFFIEIPHYFENGEKIYPIIVFK